jgi:pilus assembly protein CpaB
MKARRLLTALFAALAISGVATVWLGSKISKPKPVVVAAAQRFVGAANNLEAGAVLQPTDLKMVDWPAGVPLDGSTDKMDGVVGRTLLYPVAAGQPISSHQVSQAGAGIGLSARIPDGMRAISLKSDEIVGVAGFLLPGTHVDVLMTYRDTNSQNSITITVLQNAQVLTTGQKTVADPKGEANTASVVTLLVTPLDAEKLTLASAQGSIHFVLRNGADQNENQLKPQDINTLAGIQKPVVKAPQAVKAPAPPPQPYSIETIRGDKSSSESFK